MNRPNSIAGALAFALVLALAAAPAAAQWTPDRAFEIKRLGDVAVSPDGSRVAFTIRTPVVEGSESEWRSQVWLAAADGSGAVQLTRGEEGAGSPAWSHDGRSILFTSSRGGESDVWRLPVAGGEAERLTETRTGVAAFALSPDGRRLAFTMRDSLTTAEAEAREEKRDAKVIDEGLKRMGLYVVDLDAPLEARTPRRLSPADASVGAWSGQPMDWSPDGAAIAFAHMPTPNIGDWPKADLSVVDVASGRVRAVSATAAAEGDPHYSPDGRWLAFTRSDEPVTWAFTSDVWVAPAAGGEARRLAETFDRQPGIVEWTADGGALLVEETRGTLSRLYSLPADGGQPADVAPGELMIGGASLNAGGTHLGFIAQAPDRPSEVFITEARRFRPVQVTRVQPAVEGELGRTEVVRWTSKDGTEVEGLLTYPVGWREGARVPLLAVIHGGPTGVHTQSFIGGASQYPIAVFASKGYAVLRPNPRGSSGYGHAFRYANYGDWGGGDYQDIMAGVDAMVERGVADPARLGVMGWSYGGYMTSWVITQTDRFRAASVGAGLPNLMSFTGTADVPDFVPDYFGGDYWDRKEAWEAHSPMFQVGGVSTPTLIQHGEEDARVPVSQGYELYNALKRQGVPTKMVVYPRQGHGISEPKLLRDAMERNLEWFDRWVSSRPPVSD